MASQVAHQLRLYLTDNSPIHSRKIPFFVLLTRKEEGFSTHILESHPSQQHTNHPFRDLVLQNFRALFTIWFGEYGICIIFQVPTFIVHEFE